MYTVPRKTTIKVWQAAAKRRLFQHFSHTIARPIFSPFLLPTEPWKWVREAWPPPWLLISFLWRILDRTDVSFIYPPSPPALLVLAIHHCSLIRLQLGHCHCLDSDPSRTSKRLPFRPGPDLRQ